MYTTYFFRFFSFFLLLVFGAYWSLCIRRVFRFIVRNTDVIRLFGYSFCFVLDFCGLVFPAASFLFDVRRRVEIKDQKSFDIAILSPFVVDAEFTNKPVRLKKVKTFVAAFHLLIKYILIPIGQN